MNSNSFFIALFLSLFVFASCKKEEDHPSTNPAIDLVTPLSGQQFANGDTVWVKGSITHSDELHDYYVEITDSSTGTVYYSFDDHVDATSVPVNLFWKSNVTGSVTARIKMEAEDHNGRKAELSRFIHISQ